MKKFNAIFFLSLLLAVFVSGCKKEIDWDALGPNTSPESGNGIPAKEETKSEFFISYKVDGVSVTEKEVSALRNITSVPRSLTIAGTMASAASPKFKFFSEESVIGFVAGLNTGNTSATNPFSYVEYTNASNVLYSSANDTDGVYVFFSEISYTNGGVIKGTFSGQVKAANGNVVQITEGKFNLKFSN